MMGGLILLQVLSAVTITLTSTSLCDVASPRASDPKINAARHRSSCSRRRMHRHAGRKRSGIAGGISDTRVSFSWMLRLPFMRSIHHPIFSQRNNLSTVEPHNRRSLKASASPGKGALKHPLKKADLTCDVEGGNVPAVDLVAVSQPRIYPPANLLHTSIGKAVRFYDHTCRVQAA